MRKFKLRKQAVMVTMNDLKALGRDEALMVSLFNDRMKSSLKNGDQFRDVQGYYIIYTVKEFSKNFGCSVSTASDIMTRLRKHGYVVTKRIGFNKPNKIYLPHFFETFRLIEDKNDSNSGQNKPHNDHNSENSDYRSNGNTENHNYEKNSREEFAYYPASRNADKSTFSKKEPVKSQAPQGILKSRIMDHQNLESNQKSFNQRDETVNSINTRARGIRHTELPRFNQLNYLEKWKMGVLGKMKLNKGVVDAIINVCHGDVTKCYWLTGIMNNAKRHVEKKWRMDKTEQTKVQSRYECNIHFRSELDNCIQYIASKLPKKIEMNEKAKYWTTSFVNFFEWAMGITGFNVDSDPRYSAVDEVADEDLNPNKKPKIPMFKII